MKVFCVLMALAAGVAALGAAATAADGESSEFSSDENARLYAVRSAPNEDARVAARHALARFYARAELHVETIAALGEAQDDEARLMRASAALALSRYEAALDALADERLAGDPSAAAMRAVALARLGAFEAAGRDFARAAPSSGATSSFLTEFLVLKGETALALGDLAGARTALADAANLAGRSSPEIELLSAALAVASGEAGARERYRGLARTAPPRVAALAVLRLLAADLEAGAVTRARARADLAALRLRWSGGVFAREALEVAASAETDIARRIDALGRLAREHARSDAATLARAELQSALATLLDEESRDPREVARLFYANVEFAPLGAAGDAMVRRLADRLIRLDLLKEAAELLDHQVFKRLRGVERSRVAADLAQVHLDDRRPSEALRVLRATRMAGIDAATLERRRLLEATALERTGSADAALELLAEARGLSLDLKADIAWRAQRWGEAAASYRALLDGAAAPLSEREREALLRAAAAFLLADDRAGFLSLRAEASARFGAFPEKELIGVMNLEDGDSGAKFLDAYRQLYSKS